jgi:hypothetical protein
MSGCHLHFGDSRVMLPNLPSQVADCCICDPIYPEINRRYGRMSEMEWHEMMEKVVPSVRRILKPTGSAMFTVQPNSESVGRMRLWVWRFLLRWAEEWGLVQDAYWWNHAALPTGVTQQANGLLRSSVKNCIWFGLPNCYRDQSQVLWEPSRAATLMGLEDRAFLRPSGHRVNPGRMSRTIMERGGVTPFNLIPLAPGAGGRPVKGASTPHALASWWIKYICPPGGTVLDPFMGAGTIGAAALAQGRQYIGIERDRTSFEIATSWLGRTSAAQK